MQQGIIRLLTYGKPEANDTSVFPPVGEQCPAQLLSCLRKSAAGSIGYYTGETGIGDNMMGEIRDVTASTLST